MIQWIANTLRTLPAPNDAWADIIGHVAWPSVVVLLVFRFRRYLKTFLETIAGRLQTDHVKIGLFELTPNAPVWVLDPDEADESTFKLEPVDVQRIEAIFEFIGSDDGLRKIARWLNETAGPTLEIDDFVTLPEHANLRERAFREVEGLSL